MTNDDYAHRKTTPEEMAAAVDGLFPVDGTAHAARILGMQKRSVDRMYTGYSSTPPRIIDKLHAQTAVKNEFMAGLEALIAAAEAAGTHPLTIRYALVDVVRGGRFDGDHEPI